MGYYYAMPNGAGSYYVQDWETPENAAYAPHNIEAWKEHENAQSAANRQTNANFQPTPGGPASPTLDVDPFQGIEASVPQGTSGAAGGNIQQLMTGAQQSGSGSATPYTPTSSRNFNLYTPSGGAATDTLGNLQTLFNRRGEDSIYDWGRGVEAMRFPWEGEFSAEDTAAGDEFNQWLRGSLGQSSPPVSPSPMASSPSPTWTATAQEMTPAQRAEDEARYGTAANPEVIPATNLPPAQTTVLDGSNAPDKRFLGSAVPQGNVGPSAGGGISYDEFDVPQIGGINLPDTPMVSPTFDPEFQRYMDQWINQQAGDAGRDFAFDPAQVDLDAIPQTTAREPERNSALEFLLSGQGFGDDIMGIMKAQATEDITRQGAGNRGSARMMAQRAGLADSPAGMALELQSNRRMGDDINRAQNSLNVENAGRGLENRRMGASMELGRSTTAAGMANEAALANASRRFGGMQQNVQNIQQQQMGRAGAQSGVRQNLAGQYGAATLGRATDADNTNTSNQINRGLNQAQLDRSRDQFNVGTQENRYGQGMNLLGSLAGGVNPQGYDIGGASQGQSPNLIPAQTFGNVSNQLLDWWNKRQGVVGTPPAQQGIH